MSTHLKGGATIQGDYSDSDEVYASVQKYYGKVLSSSKDLVTNACTASGAPIFAVREALKAVPREITDKFYGCGSPLPMGIEGLTVLDLGSGSGQDCYLACKFVGPNGHVVGVDMTDEQLSVARAHIEVYTARLGHAKPNMEFRKGYIEFLDKAGIAQNSVDVVISNCVVNLSPNKRKVLEGVYAALKEGGEFYFSDVYADRRLPDHVRTHEILLGECISGALYIEDFKRICHQVTFTPNLYAVLPTICAGWLRRPSAAKGVAHHGTRTPHRMAMERESRWGLAGNVGGPAGNAREC